MDLLTQNALLKFTLSMNLPVLSQSGDRAGGVLLQRAEPLSRHVSAVQDGRGWLDTSRSHRRLQSSAHAHAGPGSHHCLLTKFNHRGAVRRRGAHARSAELAKLGVARRAERPQRPGRRAPPFTQCHGQRARKVSS